MMTRPPLSGEQISQLLKLLKEVDSVELKLTVPESDHRSTIAALDMDPLDAQIRQVVFFDTPDLALYRDGLVARARRTQGRADDSVIKLRPVDPNEMPSALRSSKHFVIEVDAMPGGYVCSGALKAELGSSDVRAAQAGRCRPRKLFTKQQRALFAEHAPEGCSLDDLAVLGPITVLKLKLAPADLGRRVAAELWNYPDGSRILELSTKTAPRDAFQAAAEMKAFMADRGVDLSGEQQTKTRTALEYFSQVLTAAR
jgi:hypothetical protein